MSATPSTSRVASFVTATLGRDTVQVTHLPGSVANHDFAVTLSDGSAVVLKVGPGQEMAAEAWTCRRLFGAGIPVPRVAALDLDPGLDGLPTLILDVVAGRPSDHPQVASDAGRWMRRIHAEELPGWGPLVVDDHKAPAEARGRYDSWADVVHAELAGLPTLIAAGVIDPDLAATARSCVLVDDLLGFAAPGVLLHNDLKPAHLFGDPDTNGLAAIIDWGDARVGDPRADLARLSMSGPAITTPFLAGYGITSSLELEDSLARYRILWNVAALAYEHAAGGDWFDAYRTGIIADTQRLVDNRDR